MMLIYTIILYNMDSRNSGRLQKSCTPSYIVCITNSCLTWFRNSYLKNKRKRKNNWYKGIQFSRLKILDFYSQNQLKQLNKIPSTRFRIYLSYSGFSFYKFLCTQGVIFSTFLSRNEPVWCAKLLSFRKNIRIQLECQKIAQIWFTVF